MRTLSAGLCFSFFLVLAIIPASEASTPAASFVVNTTSGTIPCGIQFIDTSTNSPSAWVWSFGDGHTSSEKNPTHTYTTAGTYTVTLTSTNRAGSNTVTQTGMITPYFAVPLVAFTTNVTTGTVPLSVGFSDSSTNSPTSWYWYFGDGSTSTDQNPAYEYTEAGTYSVSLTATNTAGSNTTTRSSLITVTAITSPVVSFTSDITTGTAPLRVQFTDTSSNSPTSWQWTFGDGISSTARNPSHTYTSAGIYTVLFSASNAGGSRSKTVNDYIVVSAPITSTTVLTTRPVTVTSTSTPLLTSTAVTMEAAPVNQTASSSEESSGLLPIIVIAFVILACIGVITLKRNPPRGPRRLRGREL